MKNRIYRTQIDGKPIVNIMGKLDSAEILKESLTEILVHQSNQNMEQDSCRCVIDLKDTELITDECLRIFCDYAVKCRIEFKNYSLYVEHLLRENALIK